VNALWAAVAAAVGGLLVWAVHFFIITPKAVKDAVSADVKEDKLVSEKDAAIAVQEAAVKHQETTQKVEALKVAEEKEKTNDPVATANALLRDAVGRRGH